MTVDLDVLRAGPATAGPDGRPARLVLRRLGAAFAIQLEHDPDTPAARYDPGYHSLGLDEAEARRDFDRQVARARPGVAPPTAAGRPPGPPPGSPAGRPDGPGPAPDP
jgi:hypothetical protein